MFKKSANDILVQMAKDILSKKIDIYKEQNVLSLLDAITAAEEEFDAGGPIPSPSDLEIIEQVTNLLQSYLSEMEAGYLGTKAPANER